MAKYPVKMLKDEQNQPFVPLVSAESIYTNDDLSFEEKFATKLEADNLKEGNGIILEQNGNDTTISVDFGATDNIIDNFNGLLKEEKKPAKKPAAKKPTNKKPAAPKAPEAKPAE